ncbi:protein FAM170A-like [Manis javanica]|uniref:protein FAM170A-like n=1 Tax=Manis javanica TaxID=9974 RepID=UPI003C6D87B7
MHIDPSKGHICTFVFIPQFENSQEDSPEPEKHVVVGDDNQTPGEESSDSEYVSCVSSPGQLPAAAEDGGGGRIPQLYHNIPCTGPLEMTQPQVLEEWEASSLSSEDSFPPSLGRARIKKIYYRRVQTKSGMPVSWDEVEVYEPASRKSKRENLAYSEVAEEASQTWSLLSTLERMDVSDNSEAPQEREQPGSAAEPPAQEGEQPGSAGEPPAQEREQAGSAGEPPAQEREQPGSAGEPPAQEGEQPSSGGEPPAQEECPRAKTPEGQVALDSGFMCLNCCQVFPSLKLLQNHVDNALREGFSCQVFHHVFSWLNRKYKDEEEDEEKMRRRRRRGQGGRGGEDEEERTRKRRRRRGRGEDEE